MTHLLNADLHCHSVMSDGTLTPEALWALTDHDELGGQERAMRAAAALGLRYLTGVEVSVTFLHVTVHIVGLGMDITQPALREGLRVTRGGREERAREMAAGLAKAGITGAFEGALKYVGNPDLISRAHFARHLVESGVCSDISAVFRKYLTEGKPGFVPHRWASLGDAVRWITGSGGMAIIAHPARYDLKPTEEYALFTEFKAHGGQGMEVMTGAHSSADALKYADMCREFGFFASRGSDFHGPEESRCDLGSLPDLPGDLTPVWERLQSRIH